MTLENAYKFAIALNYPVWYFLDLNRVVMSDGESATEWERKDRTRRHNNSPDQIHGLSIYNGKATMDNGYGMFLDMLAYKLADRGKVFIRVDRFFPSSQLCSACGHKNPVTKDLRVREWTCPVCGAHHDRDINAALNIKQEGIRQYTAG